MTRSTDQYASCRTTAPRAASRATARKSRRASRRRWASHRRCISRAPMPLLGELPSLDGDRQRNGPDTSVLRAHPRMIHDALRVAQRPTRISVGLALRPITEITSATLRRLLGRERARTEALLECRFLAARMNARRAAARGIWIVTLCERESLHARSATDQLDDDAAAISRCARSSHERAPSTAVRIVGRALWTHCVPSIVFLASSREGVNGPKRRSSAGSAQRASMRDAAHPGAPRSKPSANARPRIRSEICRLDCGGDA